MRRLRGRTDPSTVTPDLDNANGGNAGSNQAGSVVVRMQVTKDFQWGSPFFTEKNDRTASVRKEKEGVFAMNGKQEKSYVLKMVLTAIFAGMGFALSSVVWFPNMAPFQHFINVLAALITGILRMMTGRTALAVIGAVIGAFLSGLLYRKSGGKLYMAVIGEVFGTGILSALAAYPVMKYLYGMDLQSPIFYVPAFVPSSAMGAFLAVLVITGLKRSGVFARMMDKMNRR